MARSEIVRLVSRALAIIQFIMGLEEITYLPSRLISAHHYIGGTLSSPSYLEIYYRVEVSFLFLRIAGFLVLAWLFWQCGPKISRLLLPPNHDTPGAEPTLPEAPFNAN